MKSIQYSLFSWWAFSTGGTFFGPRACRRFFVRHTGFFAALVLLQDDDSNGFVRCQAAAARSVYLGADLQRIASSKTYKLSRTLNRNMQRFIPPTCSDRVGRMICFVCAGKVREKPLRELRLRG